MFGLSSNTKEGINAIVEDIFDRISLNMIGDIPKLKYKKLMVFSSEKNLGLSNLFVQALENSSPNALEQDVLRSLLESSYSYIESLKNKTRANITERIDGLVKESKIKRQKILPIHIESAIMEEMDKAKSHLSSIIETESTKLRNVGNSMNVIKLSSSIGDNDPNVFFVITRDEHTCGECLKLHMQPDGITPKVWKFSQLKQGYHKRGEEMPSAFGLHPNCRCTLVYLTPGFGFDKSGKLEYKSKNYNEYESQNQE